MLSRRPGFNMLVPAHTQLNTLTHTSMCHKWICNIHSAQFMFFEAQCCGLMSSYVCQKFERERERESEACLIAAEDELVASNTTLRSLKTDSKFAINPDPALVLYSAWSIRYTPSKKKKCQKADVAKCDRPTYSEDKTHKRQD